MGILDREFSWGNLIWYSEYLLYVDIEVVESILLCDGVFLQHSFVIILLSFLVSVKLNYKIRLPSIQYNNYILNIDQVNMCIRGLVTRWKSQSPNRMRSVDVNSTDNAIRNSMCIVVWIHMQYYVSSSMKVMEITRNLPALGILHFWCIESKSMQFLYKFNC